MCVIIIKQKKNLLSEEIARTSSRINPDGLGIIWLDTFEVTYHKSEDYRKIITERPFIAHFRYATKGVVNRANTHPFVCGNNKDEMFMHNGTIAGLGSKDVCDSKELAISLGSMNRGDWKKHLEQYDSRFVSVNLRTRSFQIYNRNLYTYRDGVWYSKANVLQDNLVAVYGTLKRGYNNYYSYLANARHIGRGKTQDKYPLIVEGLPYLVNKKGVGYNVEVDVFSVSDMQLGRLDQLEGHPRWYKRVQIPIKVDNRVLNCWVYFNPKEVSSKTQLHQSYKQSYVSQQVDTYDKEELHDFYNDSELLGGEEAMCVECLNEVEYDLFHNYHCSSCDGWFKEDEVLMSNSI